MRRRERAMVGRAGRVGDGEELQRGGGLRLEDVHAGNRDLHHGSAGREGIAPQPPHDDAARAHRHGRAVDDKRAEIGRGPADCLVKVATDPAHGPGAVDVDPQVDLEGAQHARIAAADRFLDDWNWGKRNIWNRQRRLLGYRNGRLGRMVGHDAGSSARGRAVVRLAQPQVAVGQPGHLFVRHDGRVSGCILAGTIDPGWIKL